MTREQLKKYVMEKFSNVELFTRTKDGRVNVFGRMPNTDKHGWFFAGYIADCEREFDAMDSDN